MTGAEKLARLRKRLQDEGMGASEFHLLPPGCVLLTREEVEKVRETMRANVGDSYNLITQGESPTQRRGPSARAIYKRTREALALLEGGEA